MEKELNLDGREYLLKKANASRCWLALKDALVLIGKIDLNTKEENAEQELGIKLLKGILSNLGDPSMKKLEELILSHAFFKGEQYWLNSHFDEHFNRYPQDLIAVLAEGAKFQLAPFFQNGAALFKNTIG